jgi:RNA-binding protein
MSPAGPVHPPTSRKKQSLMPSTILRRRLRAHGHGLNPLVRIGKNGLTPELLRQITHVLFDHELCKVKLESESPVDRFAAAESLSEQPGFNVVQILGRTILLYKRHPQHPQYEGERAKIEPADKVNRGPSRTEAHR